MKSFYTLSHLTLKTTLEKINFININPMLEKNKVLNVLNPLGIIKR